MHSFTMILLVGLIIIITLTAIIWKIRTTKADEKPQNTEHLRERADENPQNIEHLRELVERAMEYLREGLEKKQEKTP